MAALDPGHEKGAKLNLKQKTESSKLMLVDNAQSIFQKSNRRIAALALMVFALDQLTKWLVLKTIPAYHEKIIIEGFFKFVH